MNKPDKGVGASRPGTTPGRRLFLAGAGGTALAACTPAGDGTAYEEAAARTWRAGSGGIEGGAGLAGELVRLATLAPSSHNTQCWKFRNDGNSILVLPDFTRRCPVVDPDDHHLFVSLGCAVENLVQAAGGHGLRAETSFDAASGGSVRVTLEPSRGAPAPMFGAITARQCTRAEYDARAVPPAQLRLLEQVAAGDGTQVLFVTARPAMEDIVSRVLEANTAQVRDQAFVAELKAWLRFTDGEAVRTRDGLFTRASGNPAVPRWLASPLFGLFFTEGAENDRYAKQLRSSAGVAVFWSHGDRLEDQVAAGRAYERFALMATTLGIRNALVNQPVEVPAVRAGFTSSLGIGAGRVHMLARFGYGPAMPRSLRRPVSDVLA